MKKLVVIFTLIVIGCSSSKEKEAKTDMAAFAMSCKIVADKLKADFIIQGDEEKPHCMIGLKDSVYGGLDGRYFNSIEALRGADAVLKLQRRLPLHDKLQACSLKCKNVKGVGEKLSCLKPCHEKAGYKWEDD